MNRPWRVLCCALLLLIAWPRSAQPGQTITVAGEVERGAVYEAPLPGGLEFQLRPIEYGWLIWVGDPAAPDDNHAAIMTPPFHGPNDTAVEGWHFRNADNAGPNEPGPKNLNLPGMRRGFRFATGRADFEAARAALSTVLLPNDAGEAELGAALARWESVPAATGELTIDQLVLGNLAAGRRAWIERVAFTLTIAFP